MIAFVYLFAYLCSVQDSKPFIALLNADPAKPEHWTNILPSLDREFWRFSPTQSQRAGEFFQRHIKAWIDSGLQPDGSEKPSLRNYETWDCQAIFQTMEGLFNCFLTLSRGEPQQTIFALQANNQKQFPQKGALSIRFEPHGGIQAAPFVFRGHLEPNELAAYGFFLFWQSPWLFTIMRCPSCDEFDVPARKPRSSYIRGWHCEACRNTASAKAATADSRKSIRERWFSGAVTAYQVFEQHSRRFGNDRVKFITDRVNDGLPALQRIKRNTITRNLAKIQAEAERRDHNAKSKTA